jgi:predicted kinase
VSRTDERYPSPGHPGAADQAIRYDQGPRERPRPGSREDLQERLDRLPPGHPSSPYNADGSRRPPPPRLRDYELPPPDGKRPPDTDPYLKPVPSPDSPPRETAPSQPERVVDHKHVERASQVQDKLSQANDRGWSTIDQHYDPNDRRWLTERQIIHRELIDDLYERAVDVPCDRKAIMAGGLGGAGKSTVLENFAGIDLSQYLTINPDDIKEEMAKRGLIPEVEGLSPMEASDLAHEESSYIAKRLARRAMDDGKNVIWDITMSSKESTEARLDDLDRDGYRTTGIFVDIPVEESVLRIDDRHRTGHEQYCNGVGLGGRYVPPEVVRSQADPEWGSVNRRVFEQVKHRFVAWAVYDNSVYGRDPVLVASSDKTLRSREET